MGSLWNCWRLILCNTNRNHSSVVGHNHHHDLLRRTMQHWKSRFANHQSTVLYLRNTLSDETKIKLLHSQCCNHHIPFSNTMSSYLQSVGDRTFCIANAHYTFCHTKGSVFNTFAESSAGLGRKRHCLCILQFWEPSYSKSDIFLSAICWRSNFLYCCYTPHLLPCRKFYL